MKFKYTRRDCEKKPMVVDVSFNITISEDDIDEVDFQLRKLFTDSHTAMVTKKPLIKVGKPRKMQKWMEETL